MAGALRTGSLLAGTSAALAILSGPGCGLTNRCTVESRSLQYEAGTADGMGFLQLSQTRGAESGAWVLWHVRVTSSAGTVRTVTLREGPPDAPGRLLYDFPLLNSVPPSGVVTQVFVRTAYAGEVPFAEVWELVQSHPVSFEVAFDGDVRPLRLGPLVRTGASDWQEICS